METQPAVRLWGALPRAVAQAAVSSCVFAPIGRSWASGWGVRLEEGAQKRSAAPKRGRPGKQTRSYAQFSSLCQSTFLMAPMSGKERVMPGLPSPKMGGGDGRIQ